MLQKLEVLLFHDVHHLPMFKFQIVSIPSSVSNIGNKAFYNCSNLINVTFKEESNLSFIGNYSFSNCNNLEIIELPPQLKEISSHSFEECNKLKSIKILFQIFPKFKNMHF